MLSSIGFSCTCRSGSGLMYCTSNALIPYPLYRTQRAEMCQAWITLCVSSQVCCPLSPPTVLFLHRPARDRRVSLSELWPSGSWFAWYAFDCLKTALSRLPFVGSAIRTYLSDAFVVVAGTPPRHTGNIKQNATSQTFLVHAVLH